MLDCVHSVVHQRDAATQLILVDNGSSDGSIDQVLEICCDVIVVSNDSNHGFGRACNQGAREAQADYLLFLNTDVVLGDGSIASLVAAAQSSGCRIVQARSYRQDGEADSTGKAITSWGFLLPSPSAPKVSGVVPIFAADGACMLVERECFEQLGGFEESYFAYFEDIDLCWKARTRGWEVGLAPDAEVVHAGQATTRRILKPHQAAFLSYRNRLRSVIANPEPRTLCRMLPLQVLGMAVAGLTFAGMRRWRESAGILLAMLWPLAHVREVLQQRSSVQSARQVPDELVFRPHLVRRMTPKLAVRLLRGSLRRWRGWS